MRYSAWANGEGTIPYQSLLGIEARVVFWYCLPPNPLSTMHSSIREIFFRYPRLEPAWITPAPRRANWPGVFKSRHILLHKYVNRIMITYLWRQIQLIIPSRRFRSIECRHFDLFWKYVTWSLFPRITWYSLFHTSDLSVLKHSFLFTRGTSSVNSCSVYIQIKFNTFAFAKKIVHLK